MIITTYTHNGKHYVNVPVTTLPADTQLLAARAQRLSDVNAQCQRASDALTATYPPVEIASFSEQRAEAKVYAKSGDINDAPMLSAIAQARGLNIDELVTRVNAKAASYAIASGQLFGKRQRLEDALDNATTVAEVEAIQWN